jgi:hypothetical protein
LQPDPENRALGLAGGQRGGVRDGCGFGAPERRFPFRGEKIREAHTQNDTQPGPIVKVQEMFEIYINNELIDVKIQ